MFRRPAQQLCILFACADLSVTAAAWLAAYVLRFAFWPSPLGVPQIELVATSLPVTLLLAVGAYRACGLYEVHRLRQLPQELGGIVRATALLFLLVITVAFYRRDLYESRLALAIFAGLNVLALACSRRLMWRAVKMLRRRGVYTGRALIIGAGRTGRLVAQTLRENSWTGLHAVGFLDNPGKFEPGLLPRLGALDDLPDVVARHNIDHVFLALPVSRYGEIRDLYRRLGQLLVDVQFVPDVPGLSGMRIRTQELDEVPFISLWGNPHFGWASVCKRAIDIVGALAGLIVLAPLLLLLTVLVKRSSRGPVLFRQRRTGLGGRDFDMLKFRSMRVDAEHKTGPVWARKNDTRCTAVGRFLRRWSLDELPQLINVLTGDMSLVGPRPERTVFIEKFRQQMPSYQQRHQVKAGITGWAQINGWRGDTSARRRLECDLWYINNWSLWLDIKILIMTFWCGFRHRNAY